MGKRFPTLLIVTLGLLLLIGHAAVAANEFQSKPYFGKVTLKSSIFPQLNEENHETFKLDLVNNLSLPVVMPPKIKGIYISGWVVGSDARMNEYIELARKTEINAFVIDVKDDSGYISWNSPYPLASEVKANRQKHKNFKGLVEKLKKENIYLIARLVTFKDATLANAKPERALRLKNGEKVWADDDWISPFNKENWEYAVQIAREAAEMGFDEIQFDYVRFPALGNGPTQVAQISDMGKEQAITSFLSYARKEMGKYGIPISADIFGMVTSSKDIGIGQVLESVREVVDVLSPMVYPSHYSAGNFNIANPNASPYETIYASMGHAVRRTPADHPVRYRPWLQDFSMGHFYGPEQVREQIQACYDLGIEEWLLWNPRSNYTREALRSETSGFQVSTNTLPANTVLFND